MSLALWGKKEEKNKKIKIKKTYKNL